MDYNSTDHEEWQLISFLNKRKTDIYIWQLKINNWFMS